MQIFFKKRSLSLTSDKVDYRAKESYQGLKGIYIMKKKKVIPKEDKVILNVYAPSNKVT